MYCLEILQNLSILFRYLYIVMEMTRNISITLYCVTNLGDKLDLAGYNLVNLDGLTHMNGFI